MKLGKTPLVVKQNGVINNFNAEELYLSICKAVRVTRGFDKPGKMIANFVTRKVISTIPEQEQISTESIIKTIIFVSSKHNFEEIAEFFNQYLINKIND